MKLIAISLIFLSSCISSKVNIDLKTCRPDVFQEIQFNEVKDNKDILTNLELIRLQRNENKKEITRSVICYESVINRLNK